MSDLIKTATYEGGELRLTFRKGDEPGHEFRGNQHGPGEGGSVDTAADSANAAQKYGGKSEHHGTLADAASARGASQEAAAHRDVQELYGKSRDAYAAAERHFKAGREEMARVSVRRGEDHAKAAQTIIRDKKLASGDK